MKKLSSFLATFLLFGLLLSPVQAKADTTHFKSSEFKCTHCGKLPPGGISQDLMNKLETLRTRLGNHPIIITSGYRCPAHNAAVNGASNSQHLYGTAADIQVSGVPASTVYSVANEIFANGGVGKYSNFTHVDVRGYHARW
ncbi:Peptidase M15 [Clostridium cavendishii DSM 21758]|uniref:Peptidase M15 n=1 Tax=Clostridium cavendishii DSM 21758 TaxID=1121302 RepID=A0A1M6QTR2_9CLOT|nr:D-Ala-D-Ala carboxypeptidase family metallohydrolase [Clostridium cavendishii]SHK23417.1 Peptidase M15 [Clostridium cavendishii DSM 21758]